MDNIKNYLISGLAAAVLVSGGFWLTQPNTTVVEQGDPVVGGGALDSSSPTKCQGNACFTYVTGSCNTGTSTLFAILNPFGATSTMTYGKISGLQGATTTDILVGTSTTPAPAANAANGVATSSVPAYIFGMFKVTASAKFYSVAGLTFGPAAGSGNYHQPSGGTYPTSNARMMLGPNDYILGFSTSTAGGSTNGGVAASTVQIPSSCSYRFDFARDISSD